MGQYDSLSSSPSGRLSPSVSHTQQKVYLQEEERELYFCTQVL